MPSREAGRALKRRAGILEKCLRYDDPDRVQAAGLYSYFRTIDSGQDPVVVMGGREMIMLGSNNYLGLTSHPKVKEASIEAVRKYGSGCAGSRFLNGTLAIHVELEERLAEFMGKPACIVFSTGFLANLGVLGTLPAKDDLIYLDRQDHACIFDGARLATGARVRKFKHNDPADLRRLLGLDEGKDAAAAGAAEGGIGIEAGAGAGAGGNGRGDGAEEPNGVGARGKILVVDGVFSMEGDLAPLPDYVEICAAHDVALMVDDAHGIGVFGGHGRGTAEHFGVEDRVDVVMGTFSKSLATVGGFVVAEEDVIKYLKHRARALIFTAALPPANVGAVLAALEILRAEPDRRERLWQNTRFMLEGLRALGFDCGNAASPVIPIVIGDDVRCFRASRRLEEEGVFVNPIVSPATPPGRALLRTSYMATHRREHLERALDAFGRVGRELCLIP